MAITKRNSSETLSFWSSTKSAREKVEKWPTWKRNLKVTQFSVGFDSGTSENLSSDCKRKCTKNN
jgi:hypothetical protein